jgi:predicted O-linked N-acetylglucosamine transferase (SPINDLY family)
MTNDGRVRALMARAEALAAARQFNDALAALHQAAIDPQARDDELEAIAGACLTLGVPAAALEVYARLAAQRAQDPMPRRAMAECLRRLGAPAEQVYAERAAAAALIGDARAYTELGLQCWREHDFAHARAAFAAACARAPNDLPARWGAMNVPRELIYADEAACARFVRDWREGLTWFETRDFRNESPSDVRSCVSMATNFYLHYHGETFLDEQRRYARVLTRMMDAVLPDAPLPARAADDGRIRVGFCSSHLRHHTVLKLFGRLITSLPRTRFHLSAFHTDALRDADTERLAAAVDHFEADNADTETWIARLRAARLDILVYPDIGMQPITQALATRRLAPRQIALWGHPVTTGLASIDAFVSAASMEPEHAQAHYSERLLTLPGLGIDFAAPGAAFDTLKRVPVVASDGVCAFVAQQAFKLMPAFDRVLARIAAQVPELRLHAVPHPSAAVRAALRARWARAFAAAGADLERQLAYCDYTNEAGFFHLAARMDLNLDSIGWSGGNTTLELLAFDVPVVTLPGASMRSRHTAAMLRILELPKLIAQDEDDYVRIAVELARSANWREELRGLIRARKERLYDDADVIAAWAATLETLHRAGAQDS